MYNLFFKCVYILLYVYMGTACMYVCISLLCLVPVEAGRELCSFWNWNHRRL